MVEEIREVTTRALKSGGSDDALIPVKLDETDPKTVHIQSMLNIEEHAPYYFGRRWQLVRFSRKRLLTSDAPVGLLPSPDAPAFAGLGIASAGIVLFPMSPAVGLMMVAPESGDQPDGVAHGRTDAILDGSAYLARIFNETTIDSARDFLLHHPDDANLVPELLPPPRPRQLAWSPDLPE